MRLDRALHPFPSTATSKELGVAEITKFLTHLARTGNVSAATQNQALSALLFLYKEVFKHEIGWLEQVERAKKSQKMPAVQSRDEIKQIFAHAVDS